MTNYSDQVERQLIEIFTLAGEFCIGIENADDTKTDDLWIFLGKISPILYLRGLLFPDFPEPDEGINERFVTEEQWERVFNVLRNKFGEEDRYYYIEDESLHRDEVRTGSLAELYSDIYQDMKDFIWLMSKGTQLSRDYAAFNIRFYYLASWGGKLLQAQSIIHKRKLQVPISDEENDPTTEIF